MLAVLTLSVHITLYLSESNWCQVIGGVVQTTKPPAVEEETISAVSEWDDALGRPMDNMTGDVQPNERPSTSRTQLGTVR
ncbi:hypothetical protein MHYP_G00060090 [Metynnis hypsauchen]